MKEPKPYRRRLSDTRLKKSLIFFKFWSEFSVNLVIRPRDMKPIAHIAATLEPDEDKTSETVEWEMTQVLNWLKQTYTEENDSVMIDNVTNYSRGFWKGLFTCYDHYFIPRTKACHRRITGLRNWKNKAENRL